MAFLDKAKRASFGGIEFPYEEIEIVGGIRDFVHEYSHAPAGDPELLGRKLYVIRFTSFFDESMHETYPDLYPGRLNQLIAMFEKEKRTDLVVPNLGTIRAYCRNWPRRLNVATARGGEAVNLEFSEDRSTDFYFAALTRPTSRRAESVKRTADAELKAYLERYQHPPFQTDLFSSLDAAISALEGIGDTVDFAGNLVQAKLQRIAGICGELDRQIQDPLAYRILDALKDIWATAMQGLNDLLERQAQLLVYTTPKIMTIQEVSRDIYGTTERAMELLQINVIDDAFSIPVSTDLKYYVAG